MNEYEEKQTIAAIARRLIKFLESCEDREFVDLIVSCICSGYEYPLEEV